MTTHFAYNNSSNMAGSSVTPPHLLFSPAYQTGLDGGAVNSNCFLTDDDDMIELSNLSPTTSRSVSTAPPSYDDATFDNMSAPSSAESFIPTIQFQIQTAGKPLLGLPFPLPPDPIPIFEVHPSGLIADSPTYISIRPLRKSGNCSLVRGDDDLRSPLSTTTYRFGPGKNPVIRLLTGNSSGDNTLIQDPFSDPLTEPPLYEGAEFDITSPKNFSRAKSFRTHLGTFQWRYGSRKERQAAGADNQLILERVVTIALAGGKSEEKRTRVAQLVRNDQTRTTGSSRSTAGNGGRLLIDLREWADTKREIEDVKILVVSTAILMLKKEVDRRRMHQAMAIGAIACH